MKKTKATRVPGTGGEARLSSRPLPHLVDRERHRAHSVSEDGLERRLDTPLCFVGHRPLNPGPLIGCRCCSPCFTVRSSPPPRPRLSDPSHGAQGASRAASQGVSSGTRWPHSRSVPPGSSSAAHQNCWPPTISPAPAFASFENRC